MKIKYSIANAAEEILLKANQPLHYQKITALVIKKCNLPGKTPHMSVRAALAKSKKFKRVAEGVYALSAWKDFPGIRFAKDIAYDILSNYNTPLELLKLGQLILEERKFASKPRDVARMAVINDKRFDVNKKTDTVGLVEWNKL